MEQTFVASAATSCNELGLETIKAAAASLLEVNKGWIEVTCANSRHRRAVSNELHGTQRQPHVILKISSENSQLTKRLNDHMSRDSFLSDLNNLLVGIGNDFLIAFPPTVKGIILFF